MPKWIITYHIEDDPKDTIEADSVSVAGTVVAFFKHSKLTNAEGKNIGTPVAFVNLANSNLRLVEMEQEKDATVLSIV